MAAKYMLKHVTKMINHTTVDSVKFLMKKDASTIFRNALRDNKLRTRNARNVITLDTSISPINNALNSTFM